MPGIMVPPGRAHLYLHGSTVPSARTMHHHHPTPSNALPC